VVKECADFRVLFWGLARVIIFGRWIWIKRLISKNDDCVRCLLVPSFRELDSPSYGSYTFSLYLMEMFFFRLGAVVEEESVL
jgi:hypothetical protein